MPAIADLAGSDSERQEHIVAVLVDAFRNGMIRGVESD